MAAMENLNNAVSALSGAHSNLFSAVQKHVSQSQAAIANSSTNNEAAIQSVADRVNAIVIEVQAEIAKIPVTANV